MTYALTSQQARTRSRQDLLIFQEINFIMEKIIVDSGNGLYSTIIKDGTTMTESTPIIEITGTVSNPVIAGPLTVIINGTTITLGTTGNNLNSIIADINDSSLTRVVASKNSENQLVLTQTSPENSEFWDLEIGNGTANASLGLTTGTTHAVNPNSVEYFGVWQGITQNRAKQDQINQVVNYFQNLGYTIDIKTNTLTNKTFEWIIRY
jgi:hypothetical protein